MAKQVQQPKVAKVNRVQAANRVLAELAGKAALSELAAKADALVVASGGASKVKDAAWHVRKAAETGAALGILKIVRPADITIEKVGSK